MSFLGQFWETTPAPVMPPAATSELPAYLADLDRSINEIYDKITAYLCELGTAYYERYKDGPHTEFADQVEAIRAAYAEIEKYQKLADEVEERKRCSTCGAELMEGSVFCSICGTKVEEITDVRASLCPKCGAEVEPDDLFCRECGMKLQE
ncbi:MAG: zinc-ribbon domain-containing protein [Oscillibacter sp.]|nr:zinc-ribbon domain-containing protein [Oscillibacter sp.]